jgi:hypothetical protein
LAVFNELVIGLLYKLTDSILNPSYSIVLQDKKVNQLEQEQCLFISRYLKVQEPRKVLQSGKLCIECMISCKENLSYNARNYTRLLKIVQVACQLCKGGGGERILQNSREPFNRVCSIMFWNAVVIQVPPRTMCLKVSDVCKGAGGEGVFVILFMAFSSAIATRH